MSTGADRGRCSFWLAFLLLVGCNHDLGTLSIDLVWSVDPEDQPFEQLAETLRITVYDPAGALVERRVVSTADRTARLSAVPVEPGFVVNVEGIGPEGNIVSRGRTGPLVLDERGKRIELYVGRVQRFSRVPAPLGGGRELRVARAFHTATALPDGGVLLVGGATQPWRPESTRALPPATNAIERAQADSLRFTRERCGETGNCLALPRLGHTSTLLPTGNALIVGGNRGAPDAEPVLETEIFSPARGTFFQGEPLAPARWNHAVALQDSGLAVVSGQTSSGTERVDLTPSSKLYRGAASGASRLTDLPQLIPPRRNFTLTSLPDGRLLAGGGIDGAGSALGSIDVLRLSAPRWQPGPTLQVERAYHTATLLADGSVLFLGGLSRAGRATAVIERLAADGTLREAGSLRVARWAHSATLLPDGRVLVLGGFAASAEGSPSQSCELLQPTPAGRVEVLQAGCPMKLPRAGHTATLLPAGWVLVAGGVTETEAGLALADTAEVFVY